MFINLILIFIAGLIFGSFHNVLIDRLANKQDIILLRSHCDFCHKQLKFVDLIPIISYHNLGGKCRYCQRSISLQYPLVEAITGLLFALIYYFWNLNTAGNYIMLFGYLIFSAGLLVIFLTDVKYRIIPDEILLLLTFLSIFTVYFTSKSNIMFHILTGSILFLFFLFLIIITKGRGMGMGDAKYAFFMGFFFGFPQVIIALYVAFLSGALVSILLIIGGRATLKKTIPFGPFMVMATVITYLYGDFLWKLFLEVLI